MRKFTDQKAILAKLEKETRVAQRDLENDNVRHMMSGVSETKRMMRDLIVSEYMNDFGSLQWDLPTAKHRGTLLRIEKGLTEILNSFGRLAVKHLHDSIVKNRQQEVLRGLWMLDNTVPPKTNVYALNGLEIKESDIPLEGEPEWSLKIHTWNELLKRQAMSQLQAQALHRTSISDAAKAVDAKIPLPQGNYDYESLLERLTTNEILNAQAAGRGDVAEANSDIVEQEVFLTLDDARVCDECDQEEGKEVDESNQPPLHVNCRCYTSIVPKQWADLLRSGDSDDNELANHLEDLGLVPTSMAIRGPDGELQGRVVVEFDTFANKYGPLIGQYQGIR